MTTTMVLVAGEVMALDLNDCCCLVCSYYFVDYRFDPLVALHVGKKNFEISQQLESIDEGNRKTIAEKKKDSN